MYFYTVNFNARNSVLQSVWLLESVNNLGLGCCEVVHLSHQIKIWFFPSHTHFLYHCLEVIYPRRLLSLLVSYDCLKMIWWPWNITSFAKFSQDNLIINEIITILLYFFTNYISFFFIIRKSCGVSFDVRNY